MSYRSGSDWRAVQILALTLPISQHQFAQLMCAHQQSDQRGIWAGSATCARAHDELTTFPDALQLSGH